MILQLAAPSDGSIVASSQVASSEVMQYTHLGTNILPQLSHLRCSRGGAAAAGVQDPRRSLRCGRCHGILFEKRCHFSDGGPQQPHLRAVALRQRKILSSSAFICQ